MASRRIRCNTANLFITVASILSQLRTDRIAMEPTLLLWQRCAKLTLMVRFYRGVALIPFRRRWSCCYDSVAQARYNCADLTATMVPILP